MIAQRSIVIVYLYSLLAVALSAWFGVSVQGLLRLPVVNVRLIDVVILVNVVIAAATFWNYWIGGSRGMHNKLSPLQRIIVAYIAFESIQLIRTLGDIDVQSQISYFIATLCLLIILNFTTQEVTPKVHDFISWTSFLGAFALIGMVGLQLIGLAKGFAYSGQWERVEFDVVAGKETISVSVIIPLVLIHSIIIRELDLSPVKRLVYRVALASLLINLVLAVHRGLLAVWVLVLFVYVPFSRKRSSASFSRTLISVAMVGMLTTFFLGDTLTSLGYDPILKVKETLGYTTDIDRPGWDKGRGFAQAAALSVWLDHVWLGVGYSELDKFVDVNIASHNGLVTSLFHRGIIGTALLFSVFIVCYSKSIHLWKVSRSLPHGDRAINQSLVFVSWLWLIPFFTQEMLWERYSLSIQCIYFGIIVALDEFYLQQRSNDTVLE